MNKIHTVPAAEVSLLALMELARGMRPLRQYYPLPSCGYYAVLTSQASVKRITEHVAWSRANTSNPVYVVPGFESYRFHGTIGGLAIFSNPNASSGDAEIYGGEKFGVSDRSDT